MLQPHFKPFKIPDAVATPLSICFLIFTTGIYLIHFISLAYSKYKLYRPIRRDASSLGISVIKPLVGVDDNLESNLESFFKLDYHQFELLFCVHEASDPALNVVHKLMKRYPAVEARIFTGGEDVGMNPKINNMMPAYRKASYPLVLISDSGIRIQSDSLHDLVSHMQQRVGIVTQTPFCANRPGYGSELEHMYFGTSHARIYLAGNCLGFVCSTGMSCLLRREALEECGGLQAFGRYLAEDYFFGVELMKRGWNAAIGTLPAMQNAAGVTVERFTSRICRWMKLRVAMLPHTIILEPIQDCFLCGILAALSASHLFGVWPMSYFFLHTAFWCFMDSQLIATIQHYQFPYTPQEFITLWIARELTAFPTYLRALLSPEIEWRRGTYRLRWGGFINSSDS